MATAAVSGNVETDATREIEPASSQLKVGYPRAIFEKEDERHRFSCGFCGKILREPLQAECGHRFCQDCKKAVEELEQRGGKVMCKMCEEEGYSDAAIDPKEMFPDRGFKKEMMKIKTKCPNEMCIWTGQFRDYVTHEPTCAHQPLVCEKCKERVSKQKMEVHKTRECPQRVMKCEHCHADIVFDQKKVHLKDCPKVPESCSQCNKNISRDKMRKHLSQDCPNRMVICPIEGCGTAQQQSRFTQHVQKDQAKHLSYVLTRINDLDDSIKALTEPQAASAGAAAQLGANLTPETVTSLREQINQLTARVQELAPQGGATSSSSLAGAEGGATAGAGGGRGDPSGQAGGGAGVPASTGSSADRLTTMEFKVNSLEPILSVLHGEMNRCISSIEALEHRIVRDARQNEELRTKIEQYEATINSLTSSLGAREAKLKQQEALGPDKLDGTLLWKIPNFSQVRKDALAGTVTNIHSRPFYTGPMGYKMCVRLYPNGDGMGKGSYLSLFFSIMRSTHDALLPWPFKQKVYFMLVDQTFKKHIVDAFRSEPTSSSFQRPTSEMNIATGCPMFVQLSKLNLPGHGYLKDDTLYIRVLVETDGMDEHMKQFDPRTMPLQQ